MDKKTIARGIISFPIIALLIIFIIFNHEYGHAFVALQVGADFLGWEFRGTHVVTRVVFYNMDQVRAISIAGSIASLMTSIPILLIGYKKRLLCLYTPAMIMIMGEFIYWAIPFLTINGTPSDSMWYLIATGHDPIAFYRAMIWITIPVCILVIGGYVRQINLKIDKIWLYEQWQ